MIEILKAVLFGIVEGITEWLPVSSTGHLILLNEFVTLNMQFSEKTEAERSWIMEQSHSARQ